MNKKRIVLTALVGTVALAAISVTITLAWYGSSNRLSVNYLDVGINGDNDLKVSVKNEAGTFVDKLDNQQLNDLDKSFQFEPVSSMFKNNWMDQKKDMPSFYDSSSSLTSSSGEPDLREAKQGFFSRKIYLLSNANLYATLDGEKSFFTNNEESNSLRAQALYNAHKDEEGFDLTVEQIKENLNQLENCLRVSILVNNPNYYRYYIIDPNKGENEVTTFGGLLDNNGDGYYDTYNHAEIVNNAVVYTEKETVYGEVNDRSKIVYNDPLHDSSVDDSTVPQPVHSILGNSFNGISKETVYTYNEQASLANGLEFAKEESVTFQDIVDSGMNTNVLIPCYANVATEIVVSIYLEGWDRQCVNATMGASFEGNISFKLLKGGLPS